MNINMKNVRSGMTQECQGEVFRGFNDLHSKHAQILLFSAVSDGDSI